jgi:uncharacterized LabA/DUF88 family protein
VKNSNARSGVKVGVYVDVANLSMNGGRRMQYDVLRAFACRGGAEPMRLNAYVSHDADRAENDVEYREGQNRFHSRLRDYGYKVIEKRIKWYTDDSGRRIGKANVDLDLAVDALLQSENLDRVVLATGDGDFVRVVQALQNRGCRVEVVAFDNVSEDLRREADMYMSGYLVPELLQVGRGEASERWGDIASYVRGVCYAHDAERGYGFLRYLKNFESDLWRTDTRDPLSPFGTIFIHDSEIPRHVDPAMLPNRNVVFEFQIGEGTEKGKLRALDVNCTTNIRT